MALSSPAQLVPELVLTELLRFRGGQYMAVVGEREALYVI